MSKKRSSVILWAWLVRILTDWLPDIAPVMRFRGKLYGFAMRSHGKNLQIGSGFRTCGLELMEIGRDTYIAPNVTLLISYGLTIGNEVMIAHKTLLADGNHTRINNSYRFGPRTGTPITIGDGSWIAANCTVLAGVSIGKGCIVGANSSVTHDIPDNTLAGGVPAREIKKLQTS